MTASQLIQACHFPGSNNVGGWTFAGDKQHMKITIMDRRYLPQSGVLASNTTSAPAVNTSNIDLVGSLTSGTGTESTLDTS